MALCREFNGGVRKAPWDPEHGVGEGREDPDEDGSKCPGSGMGKDVFSGNGEPAVQRPGGF